MGQSESAARRLAQNSDVPQAQEELRQGRLGINLAQRQYQDAFRATAVDVRRIDFGNPRMTTDVSVAMRDFQNGRAQLDRDAQRLSQDKIPGGGTVKVDPAIRDVIESAIRAAMEGFIQH